jgi:hypothetical protein
MARLEKFLKKKEMTFVRFGSLSKTKFKTVWKKKPNEPESGPSFHTPPVKKGIFAFIWPYIDDFLWVWKIKLKDDDTEEESKKIINTIRKRIGKKFTYSGMIWCHFTKATTGGRRKGSWVEVHTDELDSLLRKQKHFDRKELMGDKFMGTKKPIIDPYKRGLGGFMSIDHLEVFIEKVN